MSEVKAPLNVGFIILPGFSIIAQACVMEPLEIANQLAGQRLYAFKTLSLASQSVSSSTGLPLQVDCQLEHGFDGASLKQFDMLVVCAQPSSAELLNADAQKLLLEVISQAASASIMLIGVAAGGFWLAKAGVLNGYRASAMPIFADLTLEFPLIRFTQQLFEIDQKRLTCTGGTAAMDMLLALIARQQSETLAQQVSQYFVHQRLPWLNRAANHLNAENALAEFKTIAEHQLPASLVDALALMNANIEEPLTTHELSEHLGISRRQLERIFKKFLNAVPSRYYLNLRLQRAQTKLREKSCSISEVALAHGFSSSAHFSTTYRQHFGISPRDERLITPVNTHR